MSPARHWQFVPLVALAALSALGAVPATRSAASPRGAGVPAAPATSAAAGSVGQKPNLAAEKFWQALQLLHSRDSAEQLRGRTLLEETAQLEFTPAQVLQGDCQLTGALGFTRDPGKSVGLLRLAAERGNAYAMVGLARCLIDGTGIRADTKQALRWLTAALSPAADYSRPMPPPEFRLVKSPGPPRANESDRAGRLDTDPAVSTRAFAHFLIGVLQEREGRDTEAQEHFVEAATAGPDGRFGCYPAAVKAALNLAFGKGAPRDMAKANAMLDQSRKLNRRTSIAQVHDYLERRLVDEFAVAELEETAETNSAISTAQLQFGVATALADRTSKSYNPKEALQWYELAADSGQVWAMLTLAFIHSEGTLGRPDPVRAFAWFEKLGSGDPPKHLLGVANLAICLNNGLGTAPDPKRAAALFKKYRDHDIVSYLGSIGQCPKAIVSDAQMLALTTNWAQEHNDPQAQYLLGERYLHGWGGRADRKNAELWLGKAAVAGHASALVELAVLRESSHALRSFDFAATFPLTPLECLQRASASGNANATAMLGVWYQQGQQVQRDLAKAEEFYRLCLTQDPNQTTAQNNLAVILQDRCLEAGKEIAWARFFRNRTAEEEARKDTAAAETDMLVHFREAERLGSAEAAFNLGTWAYRDAVDPRGFREAYEHFGIAAARGLPAGHFMLGRMHERGQGVDLTYAEAAYHFRLAALEGHRESVLALARLYELGRGVVEDPERAAFWLNGLVMRGDSEAELILCDVKLKLGLQDEALRPLEELATRHNEAVRGAANERLSRCYAQGLGVPADPEEARRRFERAVLFEYGPAIRRQASDLLASGQEIDALSLLERLAPRCAEAASMLGEMYLHGNHVERNLGRGWRLIEQAATRGHPDAFYVTAKATLDGVPGAPPLEMAIRLATEAEAAGQASAAELREKLQQRRQPDTGPDSPAREEVTSPRSG